MTTEQPNALRLAKWLDAMPSSGYALTNQAATELRRLHEENQSLNKCLFQMQEAAKNLEQQLGEAVWNYGEKVRANQELLEALKSLVQVVAHLDPYPATLEQARAAIAKGEQA